MLFFDEPSAGLDPVVSAELDELILRLRDALRMTIVVVTHELESAFKIADTITVLDQGKVLMTGTVDEVRGADNERIQDLLNRRPREIVVNADEYLKRLTKKRDEQVGGVKRDHVNYVLVGGVVLAALAVLLFALVMITGRTGGSTDYHVYYGNVTRPALRCAGVLSGLSHRPGDRDRARAHRQGHALQDQPERAARLADPQ